MVEALKKLASAKYRDFSMKLLPGINGEKVLGVRVPDIKSLAKEVVRKGGYESFLRQNHCYVEEVTLHGLILCYAKLPIEQLVVELEKLLPQIDNWGECDTIAAALKAIYLPLAYSLTLAIL